MYIRVAEQGAFSCLYLNIAVSFFNLFVTEHKISISPYRHVVNAKRSNLLARVA